MKSMFHTSATTAEELRAEIIADLHRRISLEEIHGTATARTIKEKAILASRLNLLNDILVFWETIVIDH